MANVTSDPPSIGDSSAGVFSGSAFKSFLHPRVLTMLFMGFSAGVPILLIFSSLSLWLAEAGLKKSAVTFFSWTALGYSFKFVWAPLVDRLPIPVLTRYMGRRRSWLLLSQLAVICAIATMAMIDPATGESSLVFMALAAVALGFSSATQDIVIDAFRIESAGRELQALMSSTYVAGYRIGMLVAGAGALYLAAQLGSIQGSYSYSAWQATYLIMASVMLIGVVTTLIVSEPPNYRADQNQYTTGDYLRFFLLFLAAACVFVFCFRITAGFRSVPRELLDVLLGNTRLASVIVESCRLLFSVTMVWLFAKTAVNMGFVSQVMVSESYVAPVADFFKRFGRGAVLLLAIIGLYRMSDIVLGVVANLFYLDTGFSKEQIAVVAKTFGLFATIGGGFVGGLLALRFGVIKILWLGAALSAVTNLLFVLLAKLGANIVMLYVVIFADNMAAGIATAAFIAFLSSLTNISFTAVQYAIFSSVMTLLPKIFGGYSGSMVESMGYVNFFILTALLTLPVLLLIPFAVRFFDDKK